MTRRGDLPRWLRDVPDTWDVPLLKLVAKVESGHTPSRSHPEYWVPEECVVPWFTLADIWQLRDGRQKYLGETAERVSERGLANSSARVLPAGTVVLSRTASVGFSGIMPRPMATTQDFVNFVCGPRLLPDYLLWVLRAMTPEFERLRYGSTHKTIYMPDVLKLRTPLPPLPVQCAIADYLDRSVAEIDALVSMKRNLLQLLALRRSVHIHQVASKGLVRTEAMKHSGVPSIGEVPAHWAVKRLKYLSPEVTVGIVVTPSHYYVSAGVPCPRSLNVKEMRLVEDDLVFISETSNRLLSKSRIWQGDLVVVRTGQPGTTAVVDERFDGANCIDLVIVRRSPAFDSTFLAFAMNSRTIRAQCEEGGSGAIQVHFNVGTAKNVLVAVPPYEEQVAISKALTRSIAVYSRLESAIHEQILRLLEYRQALITGAVSGRLGVTRMEPRHGEAATQLDLFRASA